jgi:hypothetical protein
MSKSLWWRKMIDFEILDKIENTSGIGDKKRLFEEFCKKDINIEFVRLTFNGKEYGVAKKTMDAVFDMIEDGNNWFKTTLEDRDVFERINDLTNYSGNRLKTKLSEIFSNLDEMQAKWFRRAILHNLEMGFDLTLVNSVFYDMNIPEIYQFKKPQLCATLKVDKGLIQFKKNMPSFFIVEEKFDGVRAIITKKGDDIKVISRNGKPYHNFKTIESAARRMEFDFVFDCEIIAIGEESSMKNYQKLTTMLQRKKDNPDFDVRCIVFDVLSLGKGDVTEKSQEERKEILEDIDLIHPFERSSYFLMTEKEKIQKYYEQIMSERGEGVILKDMKRSYKYESRDRWWKIKPIVEDTFVVTDFGFGEGKNNADKIGYLEIDVDGMSNRVGSGFTDEIVDYMTANQDKLIGRKVDIKYTERTRENKLRFPRFIRFRDERDI